MNHPKRIFVHCTATPEGKPFTVADIRRWHTSPPPKGRGWVDIAYHKVVLLDGTVANGRDLDHDGNVEEHVGAHCYGHNQDTLAVVYVGGCDEDGRPKDTRTVEQRLALRSVCEDWMKRFGIPRSKVIGHYEVDPGKACPSFKMGPFRILLPR